jgi:hypothetical protein
MDEILEMVLLALLSVSGAAAEAVATVVMVLIVEPLVGLVASIEAWVVGLWHGRPGRSDEPG